ncbi:uncharacterized protein LOC107011424 isoform X2 [Solanum pennellii]|uniref:Uncharacterized protein LOC107011424 isoform X2 n=1 Tax=Solanum pennellii TaxID=28526 RepID=A0ABM1G5V4_SOLPN|nr:uncharacterized protein LOC107011424 isoform X2 [Solanum pennellii]
MSWFARSIASTLRLEDNDDDRDDAVSSNHDHSTGKPTTEKQQKDDDDSLPVSPSRGVKDDFSELTKTLTRQFWGVASFLAPPSQSEPDKSLLDPNSEPARDSDDEESDSAGIAGLRSDIAEIGGRFKSGISKLSKNIPVSEITKMASNLLQLGPEEEEDKRFDSGRGAVGVTEEVVAFVRDIAMHPETWLDFPLFEDEDDEDFDLSDAQQEHALAVERLAPRLAALRIELCPGYMSEARFWEIYFVLLHPRLNKQDAELLSTPQVFNARASLSQELHKRTKPIEGDWSKEETFKSTDRGGSQHEEMLAVPSAPLSADAVQDMSSVDVSSLSVVVGSGTDVHPVISENQTVDRLVAEEGPITLSKDEKLQSASATKLEESDEEDADDWLKEENTEITGTSKTTMSFEDDEDVSFSDLEEDDSDMPAKSKNAAYSSDKDSQDWVQLRKSSTDLSRDTSSINQISSVKENLQNPDSKESNDWLDIDDLEVA